MIQCLHLQTQRITLYDLEMRFLTLIFTNIHFLLVNYNSK